MQGRPALQVADIFRAHGPVWREAERGHLSLAQLKVMSASAGCVGARVEAETATTCPPAANGQNARGVVAEQVIVLVTDACAGCHFRIAKAVDGL